MALPLNDLARLRAVEERISELAQAELRRFAARVDWSKTADDSAALSDLFQVAVVKIVEGHALAAAKLAADFYDECRAAAGVPGVFQAVAQPAPAAEGIRAQVRYAARWLFGADPRPSKMVDFLAGEVDKKVKQAFRDTIAVSASLDPAEPRLRRETAGTCKFCKMLAKRDWKLAKKGKDLSQVNEYHPNCKCVPVAVWFDGKGRKSERFSSIAKDILERSFPVLDDAATTRLAASSKRYLDGLGGLAQDSIVSYTRSDYRLINAALLDGKASGWVADVISELDAAIAGNPLSRDLTVFRGTAMEHFAGVRVGDVLDGKHYWSSSVSRSVAEEFAQTASRGGVESVVLEIRVPNGSRALYVAPKSAYPAERELLLSRHLRYRVAAVGERKIVLEVVP